MCFKSLIFLFSSSEDSENKHLSNVLFVLFCDMFNNIVYKQINQEALYHE